jgi:uncharacterized protein (TIGR02466 family)
MIQINKSIPFCIEMYQVDYDKFEKQSLIDFLKKFTENNPSVTYSNRNGYQSPSTLHKEEEMKDLIQFITESCNELFKNLGISEHFQSEISGMWVNINKDLKSFNRLHLHGGIISGVIYIQSPKGSGKLNIYNPGMNTLWEGYYLSSTRNYNNSNCIEIEPQEGKIFLWPSYVPHQVDCNEENVERISISFNVNVKIP